MRVERTARGERGGGGGSPWRFAGSPTCRCVGILWGVASGGIGDGLRCWRLLVLINFGGGRFSAGIEWCVFMVQVGAYKCRGD